MSTLTVLLETKVLPNKLVSAHAPNPPRKLQDIFQGSSSAETIYHKNESKDVFQAASSFQTIYHKNYISLDTFLPF